MLARLLPGILSPMLIGVAACGPAASLDLDTPPAPMDRVEFAAPRDTATSDRVAAADTAVPRGNPLWSISLASLSVTRERPVFSPSRRPAALAEAPVPAVAEPASAEPGEPARAQLRLTLVGTVVGSSEGYGIFLDPATSAVVRLKAGEAHEGWVLRSVGVRQARLQNGSATAVLSLPDHNPDAAATPVGK